MLVKIFNGPVSGSDDLEEQINHWLGGLADEQAEVKRMTTDTYSAGSGPHLVVTFLYQSPEESNQAVPPKS